MLLGAHLSIAGGQHNALLAAKDYGFSAVGMFVRNQRQWACPILSEEAARRFRNTRKACGLETIVAHGSYLVNLAGEPEVRGKSVRAVVEDLDRCGRLGIEYLVLHPGSCPDENTGIDRIADGLNEAMRVSRRRKVMLLLETTAGQGNSIGHRFEQIGAILARLDRPERFGVCLDTAHVFAAGYDFRTPATRKAMLAEFDAAVGLGRLKCIHANDALQPLGSRVDRHAHIGRGKIGTKGFSQLLGDRRLRKLPVILETPKGRDAKGRDYDRLNADLLRKLIG